MRLNIFNNNSEASMDRRKVIGKWKIIKGTIVEEVGKLLGNEKIKTDGEAERVRGRIEAAAASNTPTHSKQS